MFTNLAASEQYFLGVHRFGYEYTRYGWSAPGQSLGAAGMARIALTATQWVDGIRIPLWRLPSITGRVMDERGEPVIGVAVRAFASVMIAGHQQLVGGPLATTDDRGVYRLTGLSPGRYFVSALSVQSTVLATNPEAAQSRALGELLPSGSSPSSVAAIAAPGLDVDGRHRLIVTNFATPPPPDAMRGRAYPAQFHGGEGLWNTAVPIEVTYGDTTSGIDFALRPVAAFRVSGRIEGAPADPGLLLRLMPVGGERLGFGSEAATTVLDRDGSFMFLNVPAGSYTLVAQDSVMDFTTGIESMRLPDAPGYRASSSGFGSVSGIPDVSFLSRSGPAKAWGRMSVIVDGRDVDSIALQMHPVVKIRGRFVYAEGATLPRAIPRLSLTGEPANGDPLLGILRGTTDSDSATFTIDGLLGGTYLLNGASLLASISPGTPAYRVASVTSAGRDVTYTGLDGSLGQDLDDVVVTLTDKTVGVSGVVTGPNGPAVAGVIAFPADRNRWVDYGWNPRNFSTAISGSSGGFTLETLRRPGEYYVIAVDAARINDWTDPRFLAAAVPFATRISLGWGDTKKVDLTVRQVVAK